MGDLEGGSKRGGARDAGGENKLISLTQPAVTPPQHDINPKPRLSLFKLYESLCRRIEEGREKRTSWEALSVFLSLSPHSFDLIPSLVGYKQEYTVRKEGKLRPVLAVFLQPRFRIFPGIILRAGSRSALFKLIANSSHTCFGYGTREKRIWLN